MYSSRLHKLLIVHTGSIQQQLNQGATKALTPQQLNILRQQALLKQQQQQLRQAHLQVRKKVCAPKMIVLIFIYSLAAKFD